MFLKASNIFFLNCQRVLKSRLLFCLQTTKPHPSALSRKCERQNGPLRFPSRSFNPVVIRAGALTSARGIKRKSRRCKINTSLSWSSTGPTWSGCLWTTPSRSTASSREVGSPAQPLCGGAAAAGCCRSLSRLKLDFLSWFSGGADEPGLFQCAQRWRNQPGAGFALLT